MGLGKTFFAKFIYFLAHTVYNFVNEYMKQQNKNFSV